MPTGFVEMAVEANMNQGIKGVKNGMYKARREYRVFVGDVYIVGKKWCGRTKRLIKFPVKRTARKKKKRLSKGNCNQIKVEYLQRNIGGKPAREALLLLTIHKEISGMDAVPGPVAALSRELRQR